MNEQLYKDMAWELAKEQAPLLKRSITEDTVETLEGIIEGVGIRYSETYGIRFGAKMLSLVSISCDAQVNKVNISLLSPQKAYERNILDREESEEYSTFLDVNKFKIGEEED